MSNFAKHTQHSSCFLKYLNEMRWEGQKYRSLIQKATCKKKRKDASSRTKRSVEVDRRRGESLSIMYRARANIKFSNCKIDAAYVTSSVSFSLLLFRCRCILLIGSHFLATPRQHRVYDDATGLAGPFLVLL